jgi:hypothetical protein
MFDWIETIEVAASRAIAADWRNLFWLGLLGIAAVSLLVVLGWGLWKLINKTRARLASREKVEADEPVDPLTILVGLFAFAVAGEGMWNFFGHQLGLVDSPLRFAFLVLELGALACARRVRRNILNEKPAGIDWWIMWGITIVSGLMSASDATTPQGAIFRFIIPIFAAIMWELALNGARNLVRDRSRESGERAHERSRAVLAFAPKRLLAKLGWMDASGRSLDEVVRERVITKAALMCDRYLTLRETLMSAEAGEGMSAQVSAHADGPSAHLSAKNAQALMSARAEARKRWRIATEQAGLGSDPVATKMFRDKLAMLREFDRLGTLQFEDVWEIINKKEVQVNEEKKALPPSPPQPSRRQNGKITPARQSGIPAQARDYWVEVVQQTGKLPTTQQLRDDCGAKSPATARRWHKSLRTDPALSALMSGAQGRSPKALTSVNGSHP